MISKREGVFLLAWVLLGSLLVAVITAAAGAWGIARNDDWSFILNAFQFHRTGIVAVGGWVQMNLIGQLVLAWPVVAIWGESILALQIIGLACTAVVVVMTYLLSRSVLPTRLSVFIALGTALSPVVLPLSVSFMTDIPAAAGQLTALTLATYGMVRHRASAWWAGLAVGIWAFSIREYSVAAIAAILAAAWWTRGIARRQVATATVIACGAIGAVLLWRNSQVTETDNTFGLNPDGIPYLWSVAVTLGLLMVPALAWVNPVRLVRRAWSCARWIPILSVCIVLASALLAPTLFLGNYFQRTPPYSQVLIGVPPPALPTWMWAVLALAGLYGALLGLTLALLALVTFLREPHRPGPSIAVTSSYAAVMLVILAVLPIVAKVPLFDRYLIGVAAVAPIPLLTWGRTHNVLWSVRGPAVIATIVLGVAGGTTLVSAAQLDGARWALAEQIHKGQGIARGNIDAGFDWFRYQTDGLPRPDSWTPRFSWWSLTDDRAACITLSYAELPVNGNAAYPMTAALASWTVWTPFAQYEITAHPGPDGCT